MPAFNVPANLVFDSYSGLMSTIQDWLDRADLTGVVPQMIALCEARMRRRLDPYFDQLTATVAVTLGSGPLPADYSKAIRVSYDGQTLPHYGDTAVENVPPGAFPLAFSIEGNALRLWPAVTVTATVLYQPTLSALTASNSSNTMLQRHPDLYFYGAMLFAEGYVANDQRAGTFKALWDEALFEAERYFTAQKFAGPLVPRVAFIP